MTIVRAPLPSENYTVLSNSVVRDTRLSFRARGILVAILSRPPSWRTNATSLAREGKEGRDAVRSALRELEDIGYLVRIKSRNSNGQWNTQLVIYDTPQPKPENPASVSQSLI